MIKVLHKRTAIFLLVNVYSCGLIYQTDLITLFTKFVWVGFFLVTYIIKLFVSVTGKLISRNFPGDERNEESYRTKRSQKQPQESQSSPVRQRCQLETRVNLKLPKEIFYKPYLILNHFHYILSKGNTYRM